MNNMPLRRKRKRNIFSGVTELIGCGGLILIFIFMVVIIIPSTIMTDFNDHSYTVTVTDKQRITTMKSKRVVSKYLIYTKVDGKSRTFENTDNWFRLKTNSSDVYGDIEVGKTYIFTVVGYRNGMFSWYENIIKIVPTGGEK